MSILSMAFPRSPIAVAVDRHSPCAYTVTTAVAMTYCHPRFRSGLHSLALPVRHTDFIYVGKRLLNGNSKGLLHVLLQCCTQALADPCNRPTANLPLPADRPGPVPC